MNVNLTDEELGFQKEVRIFLEEKYPDDIRNKQDKGIPLGRDDSIRWQKILFEQGWAATRLPAAPIRRLTGLVILLVSVRLLWRVF